MSLAPADPPEAPDGYESSLEAYLAPLLSALLGIPANDVASAVRDDLRVEVSALRAFALEASEDAKTLVCSWDSEGLQFGRELPRSASHGFVVLARKRGAETLAVAMEKDNPAAELASSVDVVFATSGETAGGRGPLLNAARRLVSGALRPLLEEASAAENPQQQDDEKKNNHSQQGQAMAGGTTNINKPLLALHQRLRDFEFALATCDARAKLPEAKLVPPASVIEALKRTTEDDDEALAELVKGKEAAEACASSVARWARQAHELAALVETASEPTSTLAFPRGGRLEVEIGLWRDYEAALRQAAAERTSRAARCMSAALKRSKRFVAAAQLEDGVASLSRAVDIAQDAMKILGDLPVTRIEAASDLSPELADATEKFFQHMFKIKAARHYPIRRASMVVESASMAIGSRAARLLADADPLALTQRDCAKVLDDADAVFDAARSGIRRFRQNAAELSKLDAVGVLFHKDLVLPHEAVENRIEEIRQFRKTHDALRAALAAVLRDDDDNDGSIVAPRLDSQPSSPTGGTSIVATDSRDALGELDAAYARFAKQTTSSGGRDELPTLVDSTAEGSALWRSALDDYGRRVNKAEGLAAARLAARLDAAQSADDTFAVFARFQPLLDRALVRRAAQRHQASLIEHVRADVEALRDACTKRYEGSNAEAVSIARHAPTLASKIVWAKQVERRLLRQMARLRDVLGGQDNADRHPSGRALKTVADELLRHLDAQPLYDAWLDDWKKRSVVKQQSVGSSKRQLYRSLLLHIDDEERYLVVSFDESRASLSKEVRQLRWLGFRVPETIALIAEEARERYPIAVALDAAARSYAVASDTARQTNRSSFVVPWVKAVRDRVGLAFPRRSSNANKLQAPRVSWTSPLQSVRVYVDAFAEDVAALQEKLDVLQDASDQFKRAADALAEDGGNSPSGTHIENDLLSQHAKLQDIIDRLSLEGFEALEEWTRDAQATALTALRDRLSKRLVRIFIQGDFSNSGKIVSHHTLSVVGEGPSTRVDVEPSLPEARRRWYDLLAAEVEVAACLPKLRASRFDALDGADDAGSIIYGESLYRCSREEHDGLVSALEAVVGKIEEAATTARDRVGAWTQHLVIWRKSVADLAQSLDYGDGDDNKDVASSALERWTTTTRDAIRARASLDQLFVEEDERREALSAGECSVAAAIDARPAKERMRPRFDAWLRELRDEHSTRVAAISTKTHEALRTARDDLEQVDARSCPCRIALETMARCTELKSGRDETLRVIEAIENADSVITSRSDDWLEASRVRGAFEDLDQLLDRKAEALKQRRSVLSGDLDRELDRAARTAARLSDRWRRLRPERLADTLSNGVEETPSASDPQHALEALATFRTEIEKSKSDVDSLERAGSALLSQQQESPTKHIALELETIANRELPALVEVWERVSPAVDACTRFDVTRWSAFDPDAERESLRDASEDLTNKSPARVRQYMVFADAQAAVGLRERALAILGDIKRAPKLSETAWDKIASTLAGVPRWDPSTQKLGTLVKKCQEPDAKNVVEAVLASARADAALSDFLDELHHYWETAGLEVVSGENEEETSEPRRRLIKGWDALFAKLDEDSTGLRAMKQSPHFRRAIADGGHVEIAARRDELEVRCDELRRRLELWADAQRRWVHLDAVRSSIGRRLPAAAAKLAEADRLFSIARSETLIGDNPAVKLVLVSHKLPDQLTAVSNLLADAQQALGEYLESCRSKFARFYFVGDEDLLSILGASGSAVGGALSPHLGKLFQALDAIVETDDSSVAMRSPDGLELVKLDDSFALSTTANGDDEESEAVGWLRSLERAMQVAVARDSAEAVDSFPSNKSEDVEKWFSTRTAQAVMLGVDVRWVKEVESGMMSKAPESSLDEVRSRVRSRLAGLCVAPAAATAVETRKRELCIVEFSRQRDVMDSLVSGKVSDVADWSWARLVKMYAGTSLKDAVGDATLVDECVEGVNGLVAVGRCVDAALSYGWEYQGVGARLVRTPLTDRCFVTLAQALRLRLGASPVGPAGTGKTESVKAFGTLLGRLVVCFNCDESYSVAAMRRLLRGTCATGAFACFDELNRLSEGMLSAVSEMVRVIQLAQQQKDSVVALGSSKSTGGIPLKPTSAVFITLNPSYAGRSPLPETLKSLFRQISMVKPDSTIIARTSLLAHGFNEHETLSVSGNLVSLMQMCKEQLQSRSWYDFGLRSLAPVVARAGMLRRRGACTDAAGALVASLRATFAPRLIETDVEPFTALLEACFPPSTTQSTKKGEIFASTTAIESAATNDALVDHVDIAALEKSLVQAARVIGATPSPRWLQKAAQLRNVLSLSRGAVVVGKTGCGKTFLWRGLAAALERLDSIPVCAYVVDPKALIAPHYKDVLIGRLDSTTLEWQDGIVALILRAISSGSSNTVNKRHWIVFDGDVDPEWAENLNSVLDDNRLLTLANGERIAIPDNVRFLFEVDDLSKATPATVSRCGVLHVDAGLISVSERTSAALEEFKAESSSEVETIFSQSIETIFADAVASVTESVASSSDDAVMPFACAPAQILDAALALCRNARDQAVEAGLSAESLEAYARRSALNSTFWAAAAPISEDGRHEVAKALGALAGDDVPSTSFDLYDVRVHAKCRKGAAGGGDDFWRPWQAELDDQAAHVDSFDTVVATADTSRNEWLLDALARPDAPHTLLCGPPGSGKTMTVAQSLTKKAETYAFVPLACASGTTTADIAQLLGEHCELARDGEKWTLAPKRSLYGTSRTVVIFLDEVNLVAPDAYGTPRALALVRQLIQHGGFWALSTQSARAALEPTRYARTAAARTVWPRFVALERVRVVGACNPPSDAGRHALPERFVRHLLVMRVGTPSRSSLARIFGAYAEHALRPADAEDMQQRRLLRPDMLAEAMLDVYEANAKRFGGTAPQCVYSARDVTRWCRRVRGALDEATAVYSWDALLSGLSLDGGLIRLWAHEGLRLFADRLPRQEDREWVADHIDEVARSRFPRDALDGDDALRRPLLFSRWLSRSYAPSHRSDLKSFMSSRLRVFYEEERSSSSTMPLVVFDDVVDQVLRIDGVLRSESGHLLLIGESGCGKSMLVRFVAWMLGLDVVEVRATKSYTLAKFDEELKNVMRRAGVDAERICLLIDEADAVSSAFLERMNALLASGEVPGLWSNEEMTKLLAACREQRSALSVATSDDEDDAMIIEWFTNRVRCNLHAVFTLNPGPGGGQALLGDRATASPALFNRCVTLWFGSWSPKALAQVADALIRDVDFGGMGAQELWEERFLSVAEDKFFVVDDEVAEEDYDEYDDEKNQAASKTADKLRRAVVAALVGAHRYCSEHVEATARDFVELVTKWQSTCEAKSGVEAVAQKRRTVGLRELAAAQASVATMQREEQEALARLEEQDAIAKSRLDRMLADQSEAEAKQRDGEALSAELERHGAEIDRRKMEAETSLAKAEPALLAARTAVKGIQKKQLNEVRALRTPPLAVQRTLEVVGILLGNLTPTSSYTAAPWDEVRKVTTRADFIATIVAFEPHQLSDKLATYVLDRFLKPSDTTLKELTRAARQEDPDAKPIEPLEIGSVYKASKACGPLLEWAASQIEYAEIERRVEPLKKEVAELEKEDAATRLRVNELNEELIRLSTSVAAYKEEYAVAIRSAEQIKASMASGKQKADRADRLLGSLKSEQDRWDAEARDFPERVARLPADALRTASVVAYAGKLAELDRRNLASRIEELLEDLGLMSGKSAAHDDEFGNGERTFSTAAYAIEAETIREWHDSFGLPRDERHVENAAIFSSASRFALLVDPSGSATRFVETMLAATQSVTPIDAADPNFTKTLATAARFGSAVVVRGVDDYWDSVAHPLLEHYTASGNSSRRRRTSSVRLGTELVDVSPDFVLVLQARDSQSVRSLPLGLLGRVVVLDFSTTHESLESTVLSRLLRIERPDLERQRLEAVRDIDEQRVRLTKLEDDVLKHISSTEDRQGGTSILDDDAAVRALEQTTTEALSLREETLKSRAALAELGVATLKYAPLAACFARAYYVLARLRSVHFSYEFSLSYFLDNVLTPALRRLSSAKTTRKGDESNESLFERVSQPFLLEYSSRVARSLIRHEHRLAAALALSRIVLETRGDGDCTNVGAHIDLALRIGDLEDEFDHETDDAAARCASALSTGERAVSAGALRKLAQGSEFFRNRLETSGDISTFEDSEDTNVLSAARKAALARATAPEDVASFVASAVRGVLGEECSRAWLSSDSSPVHSAIEDAATHAQEREAAQQRKRRQNKRRAEPNGGDSVQTSPLDALVLESELEAAYAPTIVVLAEVGRDGSRDVEAVASGSAEQQLEAIAMGSQESHSRAEAAMRRCAEKGKWLLLKNAHLADREWLEAFERKLRSIAASAARGGGFCVFLAAEANPGKPLPKHLLARSHKVALGAEVGLRHALKRHADLAVDRWTRPPAERTRVYALFGWAHAVAMERVRYSGRGWSKPYEWSDVDALCALAAADVVFEKCGGAHVAPEDLQWDALAGSFVATYGSRLENDRDFKALEALADRVLSPSAFETRYAPVGVDDAHPWPDGSHFSQGAWHQWIVDLPTENPCKWLGLAPEAELNRSSQALHDLSKAHATLFHDEYLEDSADAANAKTKTKRLDDEGIADLDALRSLCKDDAASLTARELNRQAHLEMCSTPPTKRRTAALARALADGVVRLGALGNARRLLTAAQLDAARHLQVSVDELQLCCDEAAISDAPGMFRVDGLVVRGASWKDGVLSLETGKLDQSGGVKLPELSLCWRQRAPEDEHGKQIKVPLQVADDHILHSQLIVPTSPDDCSTFYLRNVVLEALP